MQIRIALLTVWGDRVMNDSLYAIVGEIVQKLVAAGAEDGEDMIDAAGRCWQDNGRVRHLIYIYSSYFSATLVVGIKVTQFDIEDGSLEFVETGVTALIVEDVFLTRAVVSKGADNVGEGGIIRGDGSAVAEGAEVLAGVEAVGGGVAEGAGETTRGNRIARTIGGTRAAVGLGVVFDKQEVMEAADVSYARGVGATTVEVDEHQDAGLRGDGRFDESVINLEGVGARFNEDGRESVRGNSKDGGNESVGRHQHLVALVQTPHLHVGTEYQGKRIESIGHADAMAGTNVLGIVLLEAGGGFTTQVPAGVHHLSNGLVNLVGMHCRDAVQREIGYCHSVYS